MNQEEYLMNQTDEERNGRHQTAELLLYIPFHEDSLGPRIIRATFKSYCSLSFHYYP